jgi:dTDP-4-dehydrorhamnose reductase
MRILVTGANGQLGSELQRILLDQDLIPANQREFELTDDQLTRKIIEQRPEIIIHAAAYTDVDGCERDPENAMRINAEGTRRVAQAAAQLRARLVYLSTDYVFDGAKTQPYTETDATNPLNIYGCSKLKGEDEVLAMCDKPLIVRTSWLYGLQGKNFVKTILEAAATRPELRVVEDQRGSPTYARELAGVIVELLRVGASGVIHACGEGVCSWYEFADAILDEMRIRCRNVPISTFDSPRLARRPPYSALSTARLQGYGIRPSPWRIALKRFLEDYTLVKHHAAPAEGN